VGRVMSVITHASTYEKRKVLLSSHKTREKKIRVRQQNLKWMGRVSRKPHTITCRASFDLTWLKLISSSRKTIHIAHRCYRFVPLQNSW